MANALLLQQIAQGGPDIPRPDWDQKRLAGQQLGQRNVLFQQQQEDRQRQLQQEQEQRRLAGVREDMAGYFMTPPEQRGAYYSGVAGKYGLDPSADHAQIVGGLVRSNPGILGPELSAKILEREFAPKTQEPFTLSPGDVRYGPTGDVVARGPPKSRTPEGQPFEAVTNDGRRVFVQRYSDGSTQEVTGFAPAPKPSATRLPSSIQKAEDDDIEAIQLATAISADLGAVITQLETGGLDLGPVTNLVSRAKNFAGMSDEVSRNFATFKSTLEKLRNDSLRLNKGVQTEGDAVRAWDEIMANINDVPFVKQRLAEVQAINERAALFRDQQIQNRRQSYGREPLDTEKFRAPYAAIGGAGSGGAADATAVIDGKTYEKRGGKWFPK